MKRVICQLLILLHAPFAIAQKPLLTIFRDLAAASPEATSYTQDQSLRPNFTDFYKSLRPSWWSSMMRAFGFEHTRFSLSDVVSTVQAVVQQQRERGRKGPFVLATQVKMHDKWIIFGTISGAFGSLVRSLDDLERQGIIDKNLIIIDPDVLIFFNGTALARGEYPLETLYAVCALMKANPDKVFYLKNDREDGELWKNDGIEQQVSVLYPHAAEKFYQLLDDFFDSVPLAFFANFQNDTHELIKLSAHTRFKDDKHAYAMGEILSQVKPGQISVHKENQQERSEAIITGAALIEGFDITLQTRLLEPITKLSPLGGVVRWRVFSGQNTVYRTLYDFYDDVFAKIVFGKTLGTSIIEVYTRNITTNKPFALSGSYELDSGRTQTASTENLERQETYIQIGSSIDVSKSNFVMGDRISWGMGICFDDTNRAGGINGQEIRLILLDDQYVPRLARQNVEKLIKQFGIRTIVLPIGTPTILSCKDLIEKGDISVFFPISGSPSLRKPDMKSIIHFRVTWEDEVEALLNYLLANHRYRNFAFFYQDDSYGQGALSHAKKVLKEHGIAECIGIPYSRNNAQFMEQIEKLKQSHVEALGFFSSAGPTQEFLRQVGAATLSSIQLFGVSFLNDDVFEAFVRDVLGLTYISSRVVPDPVRSDIALVKQYRLLMDEAQKKYDQFSLEAFICSSILVDRISTTTGVVNHTSIMHQFEQLKDYDLKGLTFTFNPETRQISRRVWLDLQDGSPWQLVLSDNTNEIKKDKKVKV